MVGGGVGGGGHWVNLRAEKRKGQRENDKRVPFDSLCPKEFEAFDLRASVRANVKNKLKNGRVLKLKIEVLI
jgi:hypothetical protein